MHHFVVLMSSIFISQVGSERLPAGVAGVAAD
jgi:hypothetical protein